MNSKMTTKPIKNFFSKKQSTRTETDPEKWRSHGQSSSGEGEEEGGE